MTEVPIYRNQSLDWFLYGKDLRHERVKLLQIISYANLKLECRVANSRQNPSANELPKQK